MFIKIDEILFGGLNIIAYICNREIKTMKKTIYQLVFIAFTAILLYGIWWMFNFMSPFGAFAILFLTIFLTIKNFNKMKQLLFTLTIGLFLSSCSWVEPFLPKTEASLQLTPPMPTKH